MFSYHMLCYSNTVYAIEGIMARTIVVATDKGGDGKSTASLILAEDLAYRKEKRVLLIDFRPSRKFVKKRNSYGN